MTDQKQKSCYFGSRTIFKKQVGRGGGNSLACLVFLGASVDVSNNYFCFVLLQELPDLEILTMRELEEQVGNKREGTGRDIEGIRREE